MTAFLWLALALQEPSGQDRHLFTVGDDGIIGIFVTTDGKRFAYSHPKEGGVEMVIDGNPQGRVDQIQRAGFSPEGKWFVYASKMPWKVVRVGAEVEELHGVHSIGVLSDGRMYYRGSKAEGMQNREFVTVGDFTVEGIDELKMYEVLKGACMLVGVARKGNRHVLFIDGKSGPEQNAIQMVISEDRTRFACAMQEEKSWRVVCGDATRGPYESVSDLHFNETNGLAFTAVKEGKAVSVSEAGPGEVLLRIGTKDVVALAGSDGKQWIVHSGKKEKAYLRIDKVVWSRDGNAVAYAGQVKDGWVVVHKGKEGPAYEFVSAPELTVDGKSVFYRGSRAGKQWLVLNGKEHEIGKDASWSVSPDGRTLAFSVREGEKMRVDTGEKKSAAFDGVGRITFSPRGKAVAHVVIGSKPHILFGDRTLGPFDRVEHVVSKERFLAFRVWTGSKTRIVRNDGDAHEFDEVDGVELAPDRATVLYRGKTGEKLCYVFGSSRSPDADSLYPPRFDASGTKMSFLSIEGRQVWWRVLESRK